MAIIQISKIQARSGNLVDLPQLDEAELGWATDAKRLFIGKTTPNENIEVLTNFSNISFSQLDGSVGNLNITGAANGQVLAYDGTNWVNRGGNAGGFIDLGSETDIKISGGAIGYVLETDGLGNLSWTPKSTIIAFIADISQDDPGVVTTTEPNFLTNGAQITITDVDFTGTPNLNGQTYFIDVLSSTTFALYNDAGLQDPVDTSNLTYEGNGRIVSVVGTGSVAALAGGTNTQVQFNDTNVLNGSPGFTFDQNSNLLTLTGAANLNSLNVVGTITSSRVISNVATGTSPFQVNSTTRVANLNVARANVSDFINVSSASTGTFFPILANAQTGNVAEFTNAAISFNALTGNLSTTILNVNANATVGGNLLVSGNISTTNLTGTLATAAQPNITSVGTLTSLAVSGNANVGNIGATAGVFTTVSGNGSALTGLNANNLASGTVPSARLSGSYNISVTSATTAGTVTTNAQPNITSVGTLTSLAISGTNNLTVRSITTGANTTSGTITGNWTLSAGSRMQATYADLAEYYQGDQEYEPGTVVEFGGVKEITIARTETTRVAGVVTTDPAYVMNSDCRGIAVAIALQGRVPVKVKGKVKKGDMMVSAGGGYAKASSNPLMGSVIGKALSDFSDIVGVIEVAIGRL